MLFTRRQFFSTVGFALGGVWLTRCSLAMKKPVPEPDPPVADIEKAMAEGSGTLRHTWTDVNGIRMHSLVSVEPVPPDAPAVVLVHGSGLSGRYMIPTAVQMTADFRVYVPDFPGFGDSDKPQKVFKVPELADWLAVWIPAIGLDSASLLGNSFGCQVIADLAARHPERVDRDFKGRQRLLKSDRRSGSSSVGGRTSDTIRHRWGRSQMRTTENVASDGCTGHFRNNSRIVLRTKLLE